VRARGAEVGGGGGRKGETNGEDDGVCQVHLLEEALTRWVDVLQLREGEREEREE
jgi:hypothetical protein